MRWTIFTLFFIFVSFFGTSYSQQNSYCAPISIVPQRCQEILPYSTWMVPLQYGVNATELIVNATNLLQTADTPLVPNQCRLDLIRLICMSSFRECIPVSVYLTPAVLQGLQTQIEANLYVLIPFGGLSTLFSTLIQFGFQITNYFNAVSGPSSEIPNIYISGATILGISRYVGYSLNFTSEAINLILNGNGVNEPTGLLVDTTGKTLFGILTNFTNGTNPTSVATSYNMTNLQMASFLNWVVNYSIPNAIMPSINIIYGGLAPATVTVFLNQWANATLAPKGLDPSIAGFELGTQPGGGIISTNISYTAATMLWNASYPFSLTNETGFGLWNRANLTYKYFGVMDQTLMDVYSFTSTEMLYIFNWLTANEQSLFLNLLAIQLGNASFTQVEQSVTATFACHSVCQQVLTDCATFAQQNDVALPNCSVYNMFITYAPDYPEYGDYIALNNETDIYITCESGEYLNVPIIVNSSDINCGAAGLVFVQGAYPPCAQPCILDFWGEEKRNAVRILGIVCCCLSIFCSILLIINLSLRKFFEFPRNLPLFIAISSVIICLGFLINFVAPKSHFCANDYTRATFSNVGCAFSGFLIHYGALSATMWWLLISFNLFLTVVVKIRSTSRKRMEISFYLIGWGLPLVFCIIALGLRSYNYDGELLYCFINVVSYELALFYVPVMIVSIIGAVIIIWIVVRVVQSTLASKGYVSSGKRAKIPRETYRLLIFLFLLLYVYSFVYAYKFSIIAQTNEIQASLTAWATCVLKKQFDPAITTCPSPFIPDYAIFVLFTLNTSLEGVLIFCFFGITTENYKWLRTLLTECRLASDKSLRSTGVSDTSGQDRSKNSVEDIEMQKSDKQ